MKWSGWHKQYYMYTIRDHRKKASGRSSNDGFHLFVFCALCDRIFFHVSFYIFIYFFHSLLHLQHLFNSVTRLIWVDSTYRIFSNRQVHFPILQLKGKKHSRQSSNKMWIIFQHSKSNYCHSLPMLLLNAFKIGKEEKKIHFECQIQYRL